MSENTKIEWADHTFNPWEGCQKVSPGCDHCYAEARNARFGGGVAVNWGPGAPRRLTSGSNWRKPVAWNSAAEEFQRQHRRRQRVFCASLADVFDNQVPERWRADLFALIEATPNLDWLLLTKRIGNVPDMLVQVGRSLFWMEHLDEPYLPRNVWLGATVVNQEEADRDIPKLLAVPAAKRFLSMEPLLGPMDLNQALPPVHCETCGFEYGALSAHGADTPTGIDWIIVGGESGPGARDFDISWARSIVAQCRTAGIAAHVKQLGAAPIWNGCSASPEEHWPDGSRREDLGHGHWHIRLKDKKGGDVEEWPLDLRVREFP